MALRKDRLAEAARGLNAVPPQIVLDGFFTFSADEIRFLDALSRRTRVVVTLPDWDAAEPARTGLLQSGFAEQRMVSAHRQPRQVVFSAATIEREVEEIARRILEQHAQGRLFREMGILLRTRDPYAPLLETTLARFGIPARSYFTDPLDHHPAVQFLWGVVGAMRSGWDHAPLLSALRMPVSGIGATADGDRMDFAWRKALPGRGLSSLPAETVTALKKFDSLRNERLHPQDWATRLKALRKLIPMPQIVDQADREQVDAWRSTAAALDGFDAALDQTAEALGGERGPISLGSFCNLAGLALALNPLRVPDRRRDVIHIMDVFEARQWELPVVFVCGLTERHFPQYHREDPLLGDAARRRAGLETVAMRQAEERSLFDFAISRATDCAVLSYPRFDQKGEETLRSFFLPQTQDAPDGTPVHAAIRPRPARVTPATAPAPIYDADLREGLAQAHRKLSASSVETFAQCAFQFFARKTLRLQSRPPAPRDRLDMLVQGTIMHRALADWVDHPLFGAGVFDRAFEEECAKQRVPMDYRTEAVRLELLRNFSRFLSNPEWDFVAWNTKTEQQFEYALQPGLKIRGRIDRLAVNAQGQALVIDYKYSAAAKIRERVKDSDSGQRAQAGLYLLAAERQFKLQPAGMLFCGLKKEVVWDGWHLPLPDLSWAGEARRPQDLRELMDTAARVAAEAHAAILNGTIAAAPADTDLCKWCDFRDACRVETLADALIETHGGASA
jgi:ATP-dependent helicase/DNAse subunit B